MNSSIAAAGLSETCLGATGFHVPTFGGCQPSLAWQPIWQPMNPVGGRVRQSVVGLASL